MDKNLAFRPLVFLVQISVQLPVAGNKQGHIFGPAFKKDAFPKGQFFEYDSKDSWYLTNDMVGGHLYHGNLQTIQLGYNSSAQSGILSCNITRIVITPCCSVLL